MKFDMKNINRKVLWRFCIGRMFETLRQEKKFKMVLLGLSKIIAVGNDLVGCERSLKWNLLRCTFLKKLPKVDIAKLMLKISIGNRAK